MTRSPRRRFLIGAGGALVTLFVIFGILQPYFLPAAVVGAAILHVFWFWYDGRALKEIQWQWGLWLPFAALVAYLWVRLFPMPIHQDGVGGLIAIVLCAGSTFLVTRLTIHVAPDVRAMLANATAAGLAIAAALHMLETLSGFAGRRAVWSQFPWLRPREGKYEMAGDAVGTIVDYIAKPTSAVLLSMLMPIALLAFLATRRRIEAIRQPLVWGALGLAAVAIFASTHGASKAALAVFAAAWIGFAMMPRMVRPLLVVLWGSACLLVLPAAWFAGKTEAWLYPKAFSSQHRVVIWASTAYATLEKPIFGIGTGKTMLYDRPASSAPTFAAGTRIPIGTDRHAHNVFLQAWFEGGVIAAVLLLAAGLPIISCISRRAADLRAPLAASFVAAIVGASISYSLMSTWFIATLAITAMFSCFMSAFAEDSF